MHLTNPFLKSNPFHIALLAISFSTISSPKPLTHTHFRPYLSFEKSLGHQREIIKCRSFYSSFLLIAPIFIALFQFPPIACTLMLGNSPWIILVKFLWSAGSTFESQNKKRMDITAILTDDPSHRVTFIATQGYTKRKWIDCSHDNATTPVEHFGQYPNFNLPTPITSGVKLEMVDGLVPATAFGIRWKYYCLMKKTEKI